MYRQTDDSMISWKPMLGVSLFMHCLIFSLFFWVPGSGSYGGLRTGESVYSVSLVEGPAGGGPDMAASVLTPSKGAGAAVAASAESTQAKRISKLPSKKEAVTIAKRTVEKSKSKADSARDTDNLLDNAISKIKSGSASQNTENSNHLEKAIAAMRKEAGSGSLSGGGGGGGGGGGSGSGGNPALRIYQMEVEVLIKSNWSFPDALANRKNIEAVVLLKVKNDGTITDMELISSSCNRMFDQSVLKAIEKSKPLPPLPEGYKKRNEELEINFNLKDLE
jgi:colicin import membrane protein